MDIVDLETFVVIADTGGVSAAATRLGISKSMVSRRLARLEEELGVQLIARTTRGTSLTEAGATFRDYAAKVTAEIDVAREAILPAGELRGRLRISAPLSYGPTHLAPILAEMARRHPKLHMQTCYSDHTVDLMAEGFDCAIRLGYLKDSTLFARRVGPIYGTVVATPEYIQAHGSPETIEELLAHQVLLQGNEHWQLMDNEKVITVRPQGRVKADNGTALVACALASLGICLLPDGLIQRHLAEGALVPVLTRYPVAPAGMFVVRPSAPYPDRKVRVLTEMLIEFFDANSDSGMALSTPA